MLRICRICKIEKELSVENFQEYKKSKFRHVCKQCRKIQNQKHYILNKEYISKKHILYNKEYRKLDYVKEKRRTKDKYKRAVDPVFNFQELIRGEIKRAIKKYKGNKNKESSLKKLNYSINELLEHIEKQFESWMNWNNHGNYIPEIWDDNNTSTWTWQLDHIIPRSDLPYSSLDDENFKKCWALENLRPYSAKQNCIDGSTKKRHKKM